MKLANVGFGESVKEPGFAFALGRFDGIFGLAFDSISVQKTVPPFYAMINQKLVESPLFGVFLGDVNLSNDHQGEISFGSINHDLYEGEIGIFN